MNQALDRLNALFDDLQSRLAKLDAHPRRTDRLVGAAIGLPAATVLAIASWLTPSPAGYGTHTQLGLGACTMLSLTGWPCPMCGMTTTFTLMAHARPVDAFLNQPFGVALFSLTVVAAGVGLFDLVTGRGAWRRASSLLGRYERPFAIFLLAGMISGWLYKCAILHPEVLG